MASSSAGSDVFFVGALLAIAIISLLLLRHFLTLRSTPAYLLVPIFLALAMPSSIILLVPIDLASNSGEGLGSSRGIWLPERVMLIGWRIFYWLTFVLTWIVLPLLGQFADSGYRSVKARMLYSLRSNARYQLIVVTLLTTALVYVFLQTGFHGASIKGMVMAVAYGWGLILAISLMGHGLVTLPRRLYRSANISGKLRRLQTHAPIAHQRMADAIEELEELEDHVQQLKQRADGPAKQFRDWIYELVESVGAEEARLPYNGSLRPPGSVVPAVITERYMADLSRKLKRARHKRIRFIVEWDLLTQDAVDQQAILDAKSSRRLEFKTITTNQSQLWRIKLLTPYMRYHVYANILPAIRLVLSFILGIASFCVIWSEVFKSLVPEISVVGISIIHHPSSENGKIGFPGQVMAACWLLYMCAAALTSVTEIKIWGNRALTRRHTYPESATWYSQQVAKLTVPLAYNFITFVPKSIFQNTSFYHFLGQFINLTPLGTGFSAFFPILILVPAFATLFNLYGKVLSCAGYGVLDDDSEDNASGFGTGGWREGKALIEREVRGGHGALNLPNRSPVSPSGAFSPSGTSSPSTALSRDPRAPVLSRPQPSSRHTPLAQPTRPPSPSREEEGNFFTEFAHRVKNTIDTADLKIQRPKWFGGVDGNTESSGRAEFGGKLGRWFGGRPDDGKVRI